MSTISGQAFLPLDEESAKAPPIRLNPKQEVFCREYALTGNATKSYAKAYSSTNFDACRKHGPRLMANGVVKSRIAEIRKEIEEECKSLVVGFHKAALTFDPQSCYDEKRREWKRVNDLPEEVRQVAGLEVKVVDGHERYVLTFPTTTDKHRAADSLAKIMAMNKEQVTVDVGDATLNGFERAARIARILDAARTRRAGQTAAEGVESASGPAEPGV